LQIDPFAYLKDVFERLPLCDQDDPESLNSLLPDRWLAEYPQHRLQSRVDESAEKAERKRTDRKRHRQALARSRRRAR